jgi:hypothetical protein
VKRAVLDNYRRAALVRGYEFTISADEFFALIVADCHYCGAYPTSKSQVPAHTDFSHSGVDRVENTLGYVSGNCVACCSVCNRAKATLTVTEWHQWLRRITGSKWFRGESTHGADLHAAPIQIKPQPRKRKPSTDEAIGDTVECRI